MLIWRITCLWRPHGTFIKIDHIISHSSCNTFLEISIVQTTFFDNNQLKNQSQNFFNIWRLEWSRYQTTCFIRGHSFKDIICCVQIVGSSGISVNSSPLPSWIRNYLYLRIYIRSQADGDQTITLLWKRFFGEHGLGTCKWACLLAPLNFTYYQKLQVIPTRTDPTPWSLLYDHR